MKQTSILIAAIAAAGLATQAHAAKRTTSTVPTDGQVAKVCNYFAAVRGHYDADKDGTLDDTERAAWHADVEAGKFPPPPAPVFPLPADLKKFDADGNGKLGPDEVRALRAALHAGEVELPNFDGKLPDALKKFDLNSDGRLSLAERTAARRAIKQGKLVPPLGFHATLPDQLKPYDLDGDGKLNAAELAAVKADIESGKLKIGRAHV